MMQLFHEVSQQCSRITTQKYSTSFSSAIKLLHRRLQVPICNIYGFVRFADEIVDTFHAYDKKDLLLYFKKETYDAIERKISLNPILNSFQLTVNEFNIDHSLIEAFFNSMEWDLEKKNYDRRTYNTYIYGSAEVVGLMCLYVFCEGKRELYQKLKSCARSLGAAFQKVNFLRDVKADFSNLNRVYFPDCDFCNFTEADKKEIESDIQKDFDGAYQGIVQLPLTSRLGVYVAYRYYLSLFKKIKKTKPHKILKTRVRIPNYHKAIIVVKSGLRNQFNLI
ncbi:MAG TPA: squalene/phytoene synthase family protein [Chitinophagaceae bacterium]|nr:squalene/phytoene synthase family protein [Chitinophagaceae bacterium]